MSGETGSDSRTRDRIAGLLHERGPLVASDVAQTLRLTVTGIRRHLEDMQARGDVDVLPLEITRRGPGRPARRYALTDIGRRVFPHAYDDLAVAALRHLAESGGREAVRTFAAAQVEPLERRAQAAMDDAGADPLLRAEALAEALTAEGYAATASGIAGGGQLCQHNCPVAHVAAQFPELCDAETAVISRLVGSHVQRLATIAHGDRVCTTHIPALIPSAKPAGPSLDLPSPGQRSTTTGGVHR